MVEDVCGTLPLECMIYLLAFTTAGERPRLGLHGVIIMDGWMPWPPGTNEAGDINRAEGIVGPSLGVLATRQQSMIANKRRTVGPPRGYDST